MMRLDERHLETLEAADGGVTSEDIAADMDLQVHTVNTRMRFLRKHGLVEYSGGGTAYDPYVYEGRS